MGWLRLLLALVVLDSHFGFIDLPVIRGHDAVEAFFVVSGYFMAMVLAERYLPTDRPGPGRRAFLVNRLLRIYPPYLVMSCAALILLAGFDVHPLVSAGEYSRALSGNPAAGSLLAGIQTGIVGQEYLFVLDAAPWGLTVTPNGMGSLWPLSLIPQAWSLSLELCFYLAAPWLALRRSRQLLALLAASLSLRLAAYWLGWDAAFIVWMRFFPSELWLFLAGMLSYRLLGRSRLPEAASRYGAGALAGLVLLILAGGLIPLPWRAPALCAALFATMPLVFERFRASRWDRRVGDLTYPFYLAHMHVIAVVEAWCPDFPGMDYWWILIVSGSLGGAAALHWGVERPINRLREKVAAGRLKEAQPILS